MAEYIIKSGLCLFILYSFYRLVLENEQFHLFKRLYLIGILIISFVLPALTFYYTIEVQESPEALIHGVSNSDTLRNLQENDISASFFWKMVIGIYLTGVVLFFLRFISNLRSLWIDVLKNSKLKFRRYTFILMNRELNPYTFLNYIFLNRKQYESGEISNAIIRHEKAHVDQKHSLDLLFIELLQIFFWFNPVFTWIKRSVKLNHEFLADQAVIAKEIGALEYSNILYHYSSGHYYNSLSSPMSQSLIKKRIIMISKQFSIKKLLMRIGLLLPVLALCVYFFSNDIVAKPILITDENTLFHHENHFQEHKVVSIKVEEESLFVDGKKISLNEFRSFLDNRLKSLSNEELKNLNLKMKLVNPKDSFLQDVNQEFSKTRLANITGQSLLPPPPPMPPKPAEAPAAPAMAEPGKAKRIEIKIINEDDEEKVMEKKIIKGNESLEMEEKLAYPEDADYYINDKKVSREKAMKVIEEKKAIQVDIRKLSEGKDVVRIYT